MSNTNDWAYVWILHFLKFAKPVNTLPFGWCVYREALNWDQWCGELTKITDINVMEKNKGNYNYYLYSN